MMLTFIISFLGNGFVNKGLRTPLVGRMAPSQQRKVLVLAFYSIIVGFVR